MLQSPRVFAAAAAADCGNAVEIPTGAAASLRSPCLRVRGRSRSRTPVTRRRPYKTPRALGSRQHSSGPLRTVIIIIITIVDINSNVRNRFGFTVNARLHVHAMRPELAPSSYRVQMHVMQQQQQQQQRYHQQQQQQHSSSGGEFDEQPVSRTYQYRKVSARRRFKYRENHRSAVAVFFC